MDRFLSLDANLQTDNSPLQHAIILQQCRDNMRKAQIQKHAEKKGPIAFNADRQVWLNFQNIHLARIDPDDHSNCIHPRRVKSAFGVTTYNGKTSESDVSCSLRSQVTELPSRVVPPPAEEDQSHEERMQSNISYSRNCRSSRGPRTRSFRIPRILWYESIELWRPASEPLHGRTRSPSSQNGGEARRRRTATN